MTPNEMILSNMELCAKLKGQLEADCYVGHNNLGGQILPEYEKLRKIQFENVNRIFEKLNYVYLLMNK